MVFKVFRLHPYMALKRKLWDLVEWILANIDAKMFDIKLVIQSVTEYSKDTKLSWMLENFLQTQFNYIGRIVFFA
jgi:hypothetical protein